MDTVQYKIRIRVIFFSNFKNDEEHDEKEYEKKADVGRTDILHLQIVLSFNLDLSSMAQLALLVVHGLHIYVVTTVNTLLAKLSKIFVRDDVCNHRNVLFDVKFLFHTEDEKFVSKHYLSSNNFCQGKPRTRDLLNGSRKRYPLGCISLDVKAIS